MATDRLVSTLWFRDHVEKSRSALFEGRIVSGRLYMEEVEEAGGDIDESVRHLAEGTQDRG